MVLIVGIIVMITLISIEMQLRKINKTHEIIAESLKDINKG